MMGFSDDMDRLAKGQTKNKPRSFNDDMDSLIIQAKNPPKTKVQPIKAQPKPITQTKKPEPKKEGFLDKVKNWFKKSWDDAQKSLVPVKPTTYEQDRKEQRDARERVAKSLPTFLQEPMRKVNKTLDKAEESKVGKWLGRSGETAAKTAYFGKDEDVKTSTGSKLGDISSNVAGNLVGLLTPTGGAAADALNIGRKGATSVLEKVAPKAASKKIAKVVTGGAGAGATYGTIEGLTEGKDLKGVTKNAAKEAALFALLDYGATKGIAKSAGIGAATMGGMSAVSGDKPKDVLINALTGAGMGAVGGIGGKAKTEPYTTNKKEITELADVISGKVKPKTEIKPFGPAPKSKENVADQILYNYKTKEPIKSPVIAQKTVGNTNTPKVTETPILGANNPRLPKIEGERGFVNTLRSSSKVEEPVKQGLLENIKSRYKTLSNEEVVSKANERVKDLDSAERFLRTSKDLTAEHVTTGHRLIDEYQKAGNFEKAVDIAETLAEMGTKAGQSIQAFSIYNRLTPEGILVHANRIANKVNEKLPITSEPVKVTNEMAAQLTDLASTVQTMKGVTQSSNDVMSILERAKAGQKLNDTETQLIKSFVDDAKKFVDVVKPFKPRKPREIKDARIRDNVISFLDQQEQAARQRIAERKNRVSATPVDIYADYAIIGAAKMARGTIHFADWSEQMVKDFGDEIRPHLENVYNQAVDHLGMSTKRVKAETIDQAEKIAERVIKSKNMAPEEAEQIRVLAEKVSSLSGDAKTSASQDLQFILQQLERPSFLQKVSMGQTIAQLLNPKTLLARNPIGNELFYRVERLNKYISTPIDWARVKLSDATGLDKVFGKAERSVTFVKNNQGEYWKNWMKGWKSGWKGVNPEGLTTQYDLHGTTFTSKLNPMTYLEKTLGASLKSFDYAGYKRAVNETLGELATLDAINRGLKGEAKKAHIEQFMRNADDNVAKIADEYGKYVTFQDNNALSVGLSKAKKGLNMGKEFGLGDLILKYPKTPGAIVMRAIEYSPAGFLRSAYTLAAPLMFKKDPNTREAMLSLSRAIVGTFGFTGLGYFLADAGVLTGRGSKDKDIRDLQSMAGQRQYQVNMSALKRWVASGFNPKEAQPQKDDSLISYDWLQPVAIAVAAGANISQNRKNDKGGLIYDSVSGGLNTMVEQSVLQGLTKFFDANPGEEGITDRIMATAKDLPASFTPTFLNQIRQSTDNSKRMTWSREGKFTEALNAAKNRVPGVAENLPQEYNTLGKPKKNFQDNNLFNIFLNPANSTKYNPSPEAKTVIDLIKRTGDETVAPRVPQKYFEYKGVKIELTPEQYSQIQKSRGEETANLIKSLLNDLNNPNLEDEVKVKIMGKILEKAGKKAKLSFLRDLDEKGVLEGLLNNPKKKGGR